MIATSPLVRICRAGRLERPSGSFQEARIYSVADGIDDSRHLVADDGRKAGRQEVLIFTKNNLRAIKADCLDADAGLARARLRERQLLDLKNLQSSRLMETYYLHLLPSRIQTGLPRSSVPRIGVIVLIHNLL